MQATITEFRQRWNQAKPTKTITFWIAAGAIVLTLILGFTRGGWTTGATATDMAATSAQNAVVARLAPICVTQANADSQWAVKHEEFNTLNSFTRAKFVEEQGWATMPGEAAPDKRVAAECAKQLLLIND